MKISLKKNFLQALILVSGMFLKYQSVNAQTSLHDSLRHMLNNFQEQAKDEKLRMAAQEALALYQRDGIDDSLGKKLLVVDSIALNNRELDKKMVLSFTESLVGVLQQSTPFREHVEFAACLSNLAGLYEDMGLYEKALNVEQQALIIRKKILGEEHHRYAVSLNNVGLIYYKMGLYDKALPLFQQALGITKKNWGEGHTSYATSLSNLAGLYMRMGQFEKALPMLQQVLDIDRKNKGEEHPVYATSLNNLAMLYQRIGQFEKAQPMLEKVLLIRKKNLGEEHPSYARALNNLALQYERVGQLEKALPLQQQALAIIKKAQGEEHPEHTAYLNNLASLYERVGQFEKVLPLRQQLLATAKKVLGEEHTDYAIYLNNLASLYENMGQLEKALPLHLQVSAIRKKVLGEEHVDYARSLNNLALLYRKLDQIDKALPLCQQALGITKRVLGEEHVDYAIGMNNLAGLYESLGQFEKALPLYQQAIPNMKKVLGEEHPSYANGLKNLGALYSLLGDHKQASPLLMLSADIISKYLARTYLSLSEQEKMTFLNREVNQFNHLSSLIFAEYNTEPLMLGQLYKNELKLKGMVLEDQKNVLNAIRKSGDSTALQLYEQWYFNKDLIGKQLLLPIARRLPYLDSLQEATTQLEQQLSRQAASFRSLQQSQQITTSDISGKLSKDAAAIEFIQFRFYNKKWTDSILYAALILLPGDSVARYVPLFEEKKLQRLLKPSLTATNTFGQFAALQKLYPGTGKPAPGLLSSSLYQLIWKPLEKHVAGVKTIYFAPAGLLHRVALGALRPDAAHLLIDKFHLKQVLSTRSVALPAAITQKPLSATIWGNIDYNVLPSVATNTYEAHTTLPTVDSTPSSFNFYTSDTRGSRGKLWNLLPGTKKEIENLQELFSSAGISLTIDSGMVASEETFKGLSGKSPQIIHLATHGFFLPVNENKPKAGDDMNAGGRSFTVQQNPMFRSGLVLAGGNHAWKGGTAREGKEDGILTAYEIARLDLSGTDLLVLSACETGLGDLQGTEGVIGLQRAFKMAGVKQLVMSLWRVPDKESVELMTLFYTNLLSGQPIRESLRKAQLKMKEKYPPYYWAAFVVVE